MPTTIKLAEYLFTRLHQLGVQSIHGVPGDYNLTLLDYVEPQGLHWVGNCNELNAGYATDAYSRIKGLGALITTFGVGELSAINAIAGAYAELAPVVHIVGIPARQQEQSRALIHHTLNDGEYGHFAKMYENITVAQVKLVSPDTAAQQIDWALQQCLLRSRPVYVQVPVDMVAAMVSSERLQDGLQIPRSVSEDTLSSTLETVLQRIYSSERPMILIDGESHAYGTLHEIDQLVQKTAWPTWTSTFGKGCINEHHPNVFGIWKGSQWAHEEHAKYVESADLILCFGPHFSGTNTYLHTSIPDPNISILLGANTVQIGRTVHRDVPAKEFIVALMAKLDKSKLHTAPEVNGLRLAGPVLPPVASEERINQDSFYHVVGSYLRPGDIVLAETGTAGYGVRDIKLPPHTWLLKPVTWLSIGYMLPATQGAALAQREQYAAGKWQGASFSRTPRTILLIGDGSLQMTVQELSTIIREHLNVLVIIINNDGYTIERCIHGWDQRYNDVASWKYLAAPTLFGISNESDSGYRSLTDRASTWKELWAALDRQLAVEEPALRMIEVMMKREDAQPVLAGMLQKQKQKPEKALKEAEVAT